MPTVLQALTGFAIGNALAVVLSIWFVHVRPEPTSRGDVRPA